MVEHKCIKCGKLFIPAPQHMYKDDKGLYCSWTCYNHRENANSLPLRYARRVEQYSVNGDLVKTHAHAIDAADSINGTANRIRWACREKELYKGFLWRYKS